MVLIIIEKCETRLSCLAALDLSSLIRYHRLSKALLFPSLSHMQKGHLCIAVSSPFITPFLIIPSLLMLRLQHVAKFEIPMS